MHLDRDKNGETRIYFDENEEFELVVRVFKRLVKEMTDRGNSPLPTTDYLTKKKGQAFWVDGRQVEELEDGLFAYFTQTDHDVADLVETMRTPEDLYEVEQRRFFGDMAEIYFERVIEFNDMPDEMAGAA